MKLRPVNIIELILFVLFVVGCIFHRAHIPFLSLGIVVAGLVLGCLYWPLGFYTLKTPGVNIAVSIMAGLLFAISLVQCMFVMLKWPTYVAVLEIVIAIYLVALPATLLIYFIKKQKQQSIYFDKGLVIRFVVYFLFVLYAFFNY